MSSGKFDPFGDVKPIVKGAQWGWEWGTKLSRSMTAGSLRRQLEREGHDPITIESAIEAVKDGRSPDGIIENARRTQRTLKKQAELKRNPPKIHGSASWSTTDQLKQSNMLKPADGRSIILGMCNGQPMSWDGEGHLLTVAPTRSGKGTMQIIPNLLNYKGSVVVLDPKGELYEHTARWRAKHVGPVYVLNPFAEPHIPSTNAFNPLDDVTDSQSALELAEILYPRTHDDKQRFFEDEAVGFLSAVIEFTARFAPPDKRNMGTIRNTLSTLDKDLYGLVKAMSSDVMPSSIRNAARNFKTKSRETGQPRVLDSLNTHLRIWDTQGLQDATQRRDFSFEALKDTPATVYLVLPFEKIGAYSTFVRMVFATALKAMQSNRNLPKIPVLFIFDEFLALNHDDRFVDATRTHASAGVRLWFFLQDLATLQQKYATSSEKFTQAAVTCYFGTADVHTADVISKNLGEHTIAYETPNTSAATTGGNSGSASYSISENIQLTARKLMTSDEIMTYMAGDATARPAIHFLPNNLKVKAQLTPWFLDQTFKERHDESR